MKAPAGGTRTLEVPLKGYTTPPLTLNGRLHWRARTRIVKALRNVVAGRLMVDVRPDEAACIAFVFVTLHYRPRDRRTRDADNIVATLKPCIDALTQASADRGWVAWPLVPDDTPEHVGWAPPIIHDPDDQGPRLWLEVTLYDTRPEV